MIVWVRGVDQGGTTEYWFQYENTVCTGCYVTGAGPVSYKFTTPPPTPIGPYTLAQATNPCIYEYSAPVTGQINMYTVATCPPPAHTLSDVSQGRCVAIVGECTHRVSLRCDGR